MSYVYFSILVACTAYFESNVEVSFLECGVGAALDQGATSRLGMLEAKANSDFSQIVDPKLMTKRIDIGYQVA